MLAVLYIFVLVFSWKDSSIFHYRGLLKVRGLVVSVSDTATYSYVYFSVVIEILIFLFDQSYVIS